MHTWTIVQHTVKWQQKSRHPNKLTKMSYSKTDYNSDEEFPIMYKKT